MGHLASTRSRRLEPLQLPELGPDLGVVLHADGERQVALERQRLGVEEGLGALEHGGIGAGEGLADADTGRRVPVGRNGVLATQGACVIARAVEEGEQGEDARVGADSTPPGESTREYQSVSACASEGPRANSTAIRGRRMHASPACRLARGAQAAGAFPTSVRNISRLSRAFWPKYMTMPISSFTQAWGFWISSFWKSAWRISSAETS